MREAGGVCWGKGRGTRGREKEGGVAACICGQIEACKEHGKGTRGSRKHR